MSNKEIDIRSSEELWNVAAAASFCRVLEETGKSRTRLAADLGMRETSIERLISGRARWSLPVVLKLATLTNQDPVRMLYRDAMP